MSNHNTFTSIKNAVIKESDHTTPEGTSASVVWSDRGISSTDMWKNPIGIPLQIITRLQTEPIQKVLGNDLRRARRTGIAPIFYAILSNTAEDANLAYVLGSGQGQGQGQGQGPDFHLRCRLRKRPPFTPNMRHELGIHKSFCRAGLGLTPVLFALLILRVDMARLILLKYDYTALQKDFLGRGLLFYAYYARHRILQGEKSERADLDVAFLTGVIQQRIQSDIYESGLIKGLWKVLGRDIVYKAWLELRNHHRKLYDKDLLCIASTNLQLFQFILSQSKEEPHEEQRQQRQQRQQPDWSLQINEFGETLMTACLLHWNLDSPIKRKLILALLNLIDPHVPDGQGRTVLDIAMSKRYMWLVKGLLFLDPPYISHIAPYLPGLDKEAIETLFDFFEDENPRILPHCLEESRIGPRQIDPLELARLIMDEPNVVKTYSVTQKADGIYCTNPCELIAILPDSVLVVPRLLIEAEFIPMGTHGIGAKWFSERNKQKAANSPNEKKIPGVFYIFNVQGDIPELRNKSYPERMSWLRTQHPSAPPHTVRLRDTSHFIEEVKMEHLRIATYLSNSKDSATFCATSGAQGGPAQGEAEVMRWWPKATYRFRSLRTVWKIGQMNNPSCRKRVDRVLPDDGVILRPDFRVQLKPHAGIQIQRIWKFKPVREMTIDLRVEINEEGEMAFLDRENQTYRVDPHTPWKSSWFINNHGLYRCRWQKINRNSEDNGSQLEGYWTVHPRDLRLDKKNANPSSLVKSLQRYHQNPWTYDQVLEITRARAFYGSGQGIFRHIPLNKKSESLPHKSFFSAVRRCTEEEINKLLRKITHEQVEQQEHEQVEHSGLRIMDLGSGTHPVRAKGSYLDQIQYQSYLGVDVDPFILMRSEKSASQVWLDFTANWQNHEALCRDMPTIWKHFYPKFSDLPELHAEILLSLHSLHYVIAKGARGWVQFMRNIDEVTRYGHLVGTKASVDDSMDDSIGDTYEVHPKGKWIILFNDGDLLKPGSYNVGGARIILKQDTQTDDIQNRSPITSGLRCIYHYPWIHGTDPSITGQDSLISGKDLIATLALWNWYLCDEIKPMPETDSGSECERMWTDSYHIMVFENRP